MKENKNTQSQEGDVEFMMFKNSVWNDWLNLYYSEENIIFKFILNIWNNWFKVNESFLNMQVSIRYYLPSAQLHMVCSIIFSNPNWPTTNCQCPLYGHCWLTQWLWLWRRPVCKPRLKSDTICYLDKLTTHPLPTELIS